MICKMQQVCVVVLVLVELLLQDLQVVVEVLCLVFEVWVEVVKECKDEVSIDGDVVMEFFSFEDIVDVVLVDILICKLDELVVENDIDLCSVGGRCFLDIESVNVLQMQ